MDVTLLRHVGEGRPARVFTVGLQTPIDAKKDKEREILGSFDLGALMVSCQTSNTPSIGSSSDLM